MGSCLFLLVAFYFVALATAGIMGDECDWTGSGLTSGTSREVTPVYLRCRAGRVTWLYPRGALRVILRLHNSNKDFRVCVRILSSYSEDDQEPDLYNEDRVLDFREFKRKSYKLRGFKNDPSEDDDYEEEEEDAFPFVSEKTERLEANGTKEEEFPARLFLEGSRGLLPLYAPDDGRGRRVRCFRSKGGQAAVFVEAAPAPPGGPAEPRRPARLLYDLQPLPAHSYDPAAEDCRPCTDQEMANAFCTSDLVARGIIVGMQERRELDAAELTVRVTKLIRYSGPGGRTFQAEPEPGAEGATPADGLVENQIASSGGDLVPRRRKGRRKGARGWFARVHVSAACGVAAGRGEFLISARRRLGALALACAPRAEQWARVAREVNRKETAHCLLTT